MELAIVVSVLSIIGTISGIILGWKAHAKEVKKEDEAETKEAILEGKQEESKTAILRQDDALLRQDMEYIKRGVDDIRLEQKVQGQKVDLLCERVTRVEESSKQAHKRIDRIDGSIHE